MESRMNPVSLARRAAFFTPLLCALAALPVLLPAQALAATSGSGKTATETRSVGEFQAIKSAGSMNITVKQGAQTSVQVSADDNLLPLLETSVEGSGDSATLLVRWKRGENIHHRSDVKINIVTPRLTLVSASGSGDIQVDGFQTPALQVAVAGSGNARLDQLNTEDLGIRISGSGDVAGQGRAAKMKVSIAGSGSGKLTDLKSDDVSVSIAGSGDAAVNAQKTLSVSIAGSGDVVYTGDAMVKSSVAGSGSVKRR
jgi:Putative auto-transporter adhesin, head GIN domain